MTAAYILDAMSQLAMWAIWTAAIVLAVVFLTGYWGRLFDD